MTEIPTHLHGTHEIHKKSRKMLLWVFFGIVGISPPLLFLMWMEGDPKFFQYLLLMPPLGLLGLSTLAGLHKIRTVTITADEISLFPIGIIFKCSDIERIKITGSKPDRYLIDMKVKKNGLHYYVGSFVWVGKTVSFHLH